MINSHLVEVVVNMKQDKTFSPGPIMFLVECHLFKPRFFFYIIYISESDSRIGMFKFGLGGGRDDSHDKENPDNRISIRMKEEVNMTRVWCTERLLETTTEIWTCHLHLPRVWKTLLRLSHFLSVECPNHSPLLLWILLPVSQVKR